MRMVAVSESTVDHGATQFDQSLKELRGLSPQLHFAAEYCETGFFNSQDKKKVLETTKDYVTRAVVTVVDHLGSISADLEYCMSETNSEETQHRIDNLAQRIGTCQLHSHNLGLGQLQWNPGVSRYHSRYMSSPSRDSGVTSVAKSDEAKAKDHNSNFQFQFQLEEARNMKGSSMKWKLIKQKKRDVRAFIIRRRKQVFA